jgi:hypothetical protein
VASKPYQLSAPGSDEQDRIGGAERAARGELETTEGDLDGWQGVLRTAIRLAGNCHPAYMKARPSVRRRFNDAVLEAVFMKERRIGRAEFSEVFAPLFSRPSSNKAMKVDLAGRCVNRLPLLHSLRANLAAWARPDTDSVLWLARLAIGARTEDRA